MYEETDVIVIGGGPGGYSLAIRLAQRGIQVTCIERENVGGVCLNWGCIPSKTLITTAHRFDEARHGAEFGVLAREVELDLPRAQTRSRAIVHHHTSGVASLLTSNGARLVSGTARLTSARTVSVTKADGSTSTLRASKAIVIATGASPRELPGLKPDGSRIVTAREAVFLEKLPPRLIVVGGGVIGVELGMAYQRLGSELTIVELGPSILPGLDADLRRVVERRLQTRGAHVLTEARISSPEVFDRGVRLGLERAGELSTIEGEVVLVAAGFIPNSSDLGLGAVGVTLDRAGHVVTDNRLETNVPGVFALGDVSGPPYLAHKAFKESEVLAEVLVGKKAIRDWHAMPAAIFSDPEVATVGLSESQAREKYGTIEVGKFPFSALGRAMALGESDGFVKLIAHRDRLIGAGIVGAQASELISELTLAIEVGATLEDVALTVHSHPTLTEAVGEAAAHGRGQALHIVNRRKGPQGSRTAAENQAPRIDTNVTA